MESSQYQDAIERFYLKYGFATRALHAGEKIGQPALKAHTNAIYQTSTFVFASAEEGADLFAQRREGYIYTRLGNPTDIIVEAKLNALEGIDVKMRDPEHVRISSIIFASGMGAISSALLATLKAGDTLIHGSVLYGSTDSFLKTILPQFQIQAVPCDTEDLAQFEACMREHKHAKVVYFETPTNPMMTVTDIAEVCRIAKSVNPHCLVMVDNTFATPYLQRPLSLGADVVIHSTTKYISGHGNVIGGAVITKSDAVKDQLFHVMKDMGACASPFDAWLTNTGLKTLPIRMDRHCKTALKIAEYLEAHPRVNRVLYPGLPTFPYHDLAKKQMKDFGGIISFEVKGGYEAAKIVLNNTHLFSLAVSLGCVDSLIQHPATMTHASVDEALRQKLGISPGLIRLSVGLEEPEDLIHDLEQALANIS